MKLKDCDIVKCDSSWMGRGVVYYVVIGDKMVSFKGDVNNGPCPKGWMEVGTELPMDCVSVYRPKHISNTFNGNFGDERLYDCLYSKDVGEDKDFRSEEDNLWSFSKPTMPTRNFGKFTF